MKRILAGAALCAALLPIHAQNIIHFYASGAKDGAPPPTACMQEAAIAVPQMKAFPHPASWTWIIVCDEMAWQKLVRHLGWDSGGASLLAMTDRVSKVTYLRGETLLNPAGSTAASSPRHVIAHELGHIFLDTSDEHKVEAQVSEWLSDHNKLQQVALK